MSIAEPHTTSTTGAHADAARAPEAEFGELVASFRRMSADNAQRLRPRMLPGAYTAFTTIARRGPLTPSALAEALVADKGQISRTVRDLDALHLITRSPDPADGRSTLLEEAPPALERLAAVRAGGRNGMMESLRRWDVSAIATLTRLLHALVAGELPRGDDTSPDTGRDPPRRGTPPGLAPW